MEWHGTVMGMPVNNMRLKTIDQERESGGGESCVGGINLSAGAGYSGNTFFIFCVKSVGTISQKTGWQYCGAGFIG